MSKIHIYIDGTWLFNQCGRDRTLSQYVESENFYIDFIRLDQAIKDKIELLSGTKVESGGGRWYYTSIIKGIPENDVDGSSLEWMRNRSHAIEQTVKSAEIAGYDITGAFEVPFKFWMPKQIQSKLFQEKMVDTSVVARMVLSSTQYQDDFHVLISGDLDMMPAISLVVPEYLDKVVLCCTDPAQWDPNLQQTSKRLTDYSFQYGPIYMDEMVGEIMQGHVYQCQHPKCGIFFSRSRPIPKSQKSYCREHLITRPVRN
ncbi:hypothetical protein [Paenibacillus sp. URB8-2]|uniref:hypothetical protein n=1 Tax=Paenibacillus sp. URB8-2 TaxID=2741301 RepID=UPI0015BF7FEF|nr:hypothetical protein [Paenibacillus sp. URB8-2]BCG56761.1 hypothetical protein PUR_01860 [Paenibacillus sp. URB8-2]